MRARWVDGTRRLVLDQDRNVVEPYTVCVTNSSIYNWWNVHNLLINDGGEEFIPNRSVICLSEMNFSSRRSVYLLFESEVEVLRNHPLIEWVERASMFNRIKWEQRRNDEFFDRHIDTNRYKQDIVNKRSSGNPGSELNFTQWGVYRHQSKQNNFVGLGTTSTSSDVQYSLTGKNVDVVIMDTGVRWDHPEFLKLGVTNFLGEDSTRVKDILIHGSSNYGIDWSSHGLVDPGTGILSNYTIANVLQSSEFNGSWHGSHVAGTAAGNQFGVAFDANIWSIACVDRSDVGFTDPSDGFDYIRIWHKNKPINPQTGRRNPTIVNCSWGLRQFVYWSDVNTYPYTVNFRGDTYNSSDVEGSSTFLPAVYYMDINGGYYEFTSTHTSSQATADELFDDEECKDIIVICSAGNSGNGNGKQDIEGGDDYDNKFLTGLFYYGDVAAETRGSVSEHFNRSGTPAITHQGQDDAPIVVGSLDSTVSVSGITSERKGSYSNNGPAIDIWSAGSTILSPYDDGYQDPRNNSFYNDYLNGTSMAAPNVTGVVALHLESKPLSTRVDVRKWLDNHASSDISDNFLDATGNLDPVGAGTSQLYWDDAYGLRGSLKKVLYNPYSNNEVPSVSGITLDQISFTQS
jgi:hypothetical protein